MEPTISKTKHKPGKTKAEEQVLDLVISYIHDVEDKNSLSLVSRMFYEIDGITRKHLTVYTHYCPNPARSSKRFPFMETLTLKGTPSGIIPTYDNDIRITPWIEQLVLESRYLKELHICHLVVHDEDLKTLARTRGKDLSSLKICKCTGFSTDGLRHVSKYCNQLRTFCLKYPAYFIVKDGIWLHQMALNSTVLEGFHINYTIDSYVEDLTLLAKNCCNSLISLKIGKCDLSRLGDAFRYAVRLEHFSGDYCWDGKSKFGFQFPPNTRSLSVKDLRVTTVLPFVNQIKKLKLVSSNFLFHCQCSLFKMCPNLEVLCTEDDCGDKGLQVIGKFCKKLRKFTHVSHLLRQVVTHMGLIALAKECTNLESLKVSLEDISNEALECLGTHLKNLRKLCIKLVKMDGTTDLPLDNGIRAMLMGCSKLERLDISLQHGGVTDVGLEYIGKYGANFLFLTRAGMSDAGLVKLSEGCPKLRKLKLRACPFSEKVVTSYVFNIHSLRYVWFDNSDPETESSSDRESSVHDSSDCGSSDRESSDGESSDRDSSDHESSDCESSERVPIYLVLTRPTFQL